MTLIGAFAAVGLLASPCGLAAQRRIPFAVEMRVGLTRPLPCLVWCEGGDPGEGTARWWNGSVEARLHGNVSLYAGYSDYELQVSRNYTATGSGFDVGIDEAFQRPTGGKLPYHTGYFVFDLGLRLNP